MKLDELTPLHKYIQVQGLTYKEALARALANKLDIYYVFDQWTRVSYVLEEDFINGTVTDKTFRESPNLIEHEYGTCDLVSLTPDHIRWLWNAGSTDLPNLAVAELLEPGKPEGYVIAGLVGETDEMLVIDNLFVDPNPKCRKSDQDAIGANKEKPSSTALKVVGLLMHHLAKSPKYASGSSPNKSQIKELLLDLADELGVNNYGLSKVDERLLAEAMRYLETQKN